MKLGNAALRVQVSLQTGDPGHLLCADIGGELSTLAAHVAFQGFFGLSLDEAVLTPWHPFLAFVRGFGWRILQGKVTMTDLANRPYSWVVLQAVLDSLPGTQGRCLKLRNL